MRDRAKLHSMEGQFGFCVFVLVPTKWLWTIIAEEGVQCGGFRDRSLVQNTTLDSMFDLSNLMTALKG